MRSAVPLSDRQFVTLLDLPATPRGAPGRALDHFLALLEEQARIRVPAFPDHLVDVTDCSDDSVMGCAARLLEHRFELAAEPEVRFSGKVDWNYDPTPDPRRRWARELHRHRWVATLAEAYRRSGDERYAETLVAMLCDWIAANPPPRRKNESHIVWTLMGVGMRASIWPAAFFLLLASPAFDRQARIRMLKSIHDHGQFLYRFKTHANHLLRETNGLLSLAGYFPSFAAAGRWKERGLARLGEEVARQVYPDGCHQEMSSGYQWMVADELEAAHGLLVEHGWSLPEGDLQATLNRMYDVLAHLTRPDGTWPQLGDGFIDLPRKLRERMSQAAKALARSDLAFIANGGRCGATPASTSMHFPYGGLAVMRSDWTPHARYLLMKAGPFGGAHGHEDKLSIEVSACGSRFLVDPGTYTYNARDPFRSYFVSSNAHNTVVVDGMSQVRRWSSRHRVPAGHTGESITFRTGAGIVYAGSSYDEGYSKYRFDVPKSPEVASGIRHQREVLFIADEYWLLIDRVEANGKHVYSRVFQADEGVTVENCPGGVVLTSAASGAGLAVLDPRSGGLESDCQSGSENPIGGWISNGLRNHKAPAPRITLSRCEEGLATLYTLLWPMAPAAARRPPTATLEPLSRGEGVAIRVQSEDREDLLIVSDNVEVKSIQDVATSAPASGYRRSASSDWRVLFELARRIGSGDQHVGQ